MLSQFLQFLFSGITVGATYALAALGFTLIYNASKANRSVAVLDFGSDKTVSNNTFTVQFPVANASNAIVRIS